MHELLVLICKVIAVVFSVIAILRERDYSAQLFYLLANGPAVFLLIDEQFKVILNQSGQTDIIGFGVVFGLTDHFLVELEGEFYFYNSSFRG